MDIKKIKDIFSKKKSAPVEISASLEKVPAKKDREKQKKENSDAPDSIYPLW